MPPIQKHSIQLVRNLGDSCHDLSQVPAVVILFFYASNRFETATQESTQI